MGPAEGLSPLHPFAARCVLHQARVLELAYGQVLGPLRMTDGRLAKMLLTTRQSTVQRHDYGSAIP